MNCNTGSLMSMEGLQQLPAEEQKKYVEVKRDLTKVEELNQKIKMYSPCGCGSGKKFRFCCHQKPQTVTA